MFSCNQDFVCLSALNDYISSNANFKASDVGCLVESLNAVDVSSIPSASIVKQLAVAIE